jgi:hypothetical protein
MCTWAHTNFTASPFHCTNSTISKFMPCSCPGTEISVYNILTKTQKYGGGGEVNMSTPETQNVCNQN